MTESENAFRNTCRNSIIFCIFALAAALAVFVIFPVSGKNEEDIENYSLLADSSVYDDDQVSESKFDVEGVDAGDLGLALYRQPASRAAVEWFYSNVTGDRATALAILEAADKNDISVSLAFALAHTESRFNVNAVNRNTNRTIDRGLFQLNSSSFPSLKEAEFFDPVVSAKYGMSHLKFCMGVAGNDVTALAMYNAGTNKVKSNKTPQSTLVYVGKIKAFQGKLEQLFLEEVGSYYENPSKKINGMSVAMASSRRHYE